jgi:hypothetical protein
MDLPITVTWPPMLYTDMRGQKWAISGEHWIEVPDSLTMDRISEYMIVAEREDAEPAPDIKTYIVKGSAGYPYTVTNIGDTWTCTCAGFGWRRNCKHIVAQKKALTTP